MPKPALKMKSKSKPSVFKQCKEGRLPFNMPRASDWSGKGYSCGINDFEIKWTCKNLPLLVNQRVRGHPCGSMLWFSVTPWECVPWTQRIPTMVLYLLVADADFWLSCKKILVRYLDFTPWQLKGKSRLKSNNEYFQKEKLLEIVDYNNKSVFFAF